MRGRGGKRTAVLLVAVASASVVAAGAALAVVGEARVKSIPGLAIAVFGTFLTSMAIIAAFSIEEGSRWPTPWEALYRARVPAWFAVALGSVVTALLSGAIDSPFLSAFSLTLALVAIPLGTWGLWGLISLSSDQGRWGLVVDLLAGSIVELGRVPRAPHQPDLGEIDTEDHVSDSFLRAGAPRRPYRTKVSVEQVPGVLRAHADRRDLSAVVGLVDEVHAGACLALERGGWAGFDGYLASVDLVLGVQRSIFSELANRVLSGQLGDATSRLALTRAGEAVLDVAGRARRSGPEQSRDPGRAEALVARHLAALSRFAGQMTQAAENHLRQDPLTLPGRRRGEARAGLVALRVACFDLQQAIRWAIDPDPPGMKIPGEHVWREGLLDPAGALVWLWSTVESASGPFGVGLYAFCQIATGRKFFESYWDGFDVFTEISRRLDSGPEAGREAVERAGGLERIALELGATRLAASATRERGAAPFDGDPAREDDRHVACNLFLAGAGYKPPGRNPHEDLAWLLGDRLGGSLWTAVYDQLSELPDEVLEPPLQPLYRQPAACALAVCLRLAPLREEDGPTDLKAFVGGLPGPLFERTAALAVALTKGVQPASARARVERERDLIEAARFARKITPGAIPPQEPLRPSRPGSPDPAPPALAGSGFEGAAASILEAEGEIEVDLVQCDPRWLDEWAPLRSELDCALLTAALRGSARVRRVVRYDLPPDSPRKATRLHYRWTESLAAAVGCFPRSDLAAPSRYAVRRLIESGRQVSPQAPADSIAIRSGGGSADEFEASWSRLDQGSGPLEGPGLIEL